MAPSLISLALAVLVIDPSLTLDPATLPAFDTLKIFMCSRQRYLKFHLNALIQLY